jgi:catechol 2,3-dioxygenase-like lactoylglutathione lyase family enzyme
MSVDGASQNNGGNGKFNVGGVLLDQPFKIRRLGHFGVNAIDMAGALRFYKDLLGFRIVDVRDTFKGKPVPEAYKDFGDPNGYFFRYGSDHHALVIYNQRLRQAMDKTGKRFRYGLTINQMTWQVGSLQEVYAGDAWMRSIGQNMVRVGRDMPGSNWHTYMFDPDGHVNELYYGIEQIGWDGRSKPRTMYNRGFHETPALPQISEFQEVEDAHAAGIDVHSGYRYKPAGEAKYDVGGILLPRPFKTVKIGPLHMFVRNMEAAVAFYRDELGLQVTEEITWQGHRCVFLRCNTEHHSIGLYPIALRSVLGLSAHTTCLSFGLQLAEYCQLRDARGWLSEKGVTVKYLPPELFPGIDYSAFAIDPDGHAIQLYHYMEQIGWDGRPRPANLRRKVDNEHWPEALDALSDSFMGEAYMGPWG